MKGKKCTTSVLLLVVLSALSLLTSIFISKDANAYNFGYQGYYPISTVKAELNFGGTTSNPQTSTLNNNIYNLQIANSSGVSDGILRKITLTGDITSSDMIPANSIFHFSVRYISGSVTDGVTVGNEEGQYFTILDKMCYNSSSVEYTLSSGSTRTQTRDMVCDYWAFTSLNLQEFTLLTNTYIPQANVFIRLPRYIDYVTIEDESGGGSIDITQLQNDVTLILNTLRQNNDINSGIYYDVEDIKDLLEELTTTGSLSPQAIENAIESAKENEKAEYEEQQEDVNDGAEDAGTEAESQTSNLIDTARGIIEVIRDTPATNCNIRIIRGAFDTGELNLCNVPQQIRTVISTIIVIPVTLAALHIAYSLVTLYLRTVRKEQE